MIWARVVAVPVPFVSVVAPPHEQWPLPWYLRAMPHVGYWTSPDDPLALQAPVVVASLEHTAALDAAFGERYVPAFYGLRPDVLLVLYVERGLWERFVARTAGLDRSSLVSRVDSGSCRRSSPASSAHKALVTGVAPAAAGEPLRGATRNRYRPK